MVHGESKTGVKRVAVYVFVGFYEEAGRRTPDQKISRINAVHQVVDALMEGIPPKWILRLVKLSLKLWQEMEKKGLR